MRKENSKTEVKVWNSGRFALCTAKKYNTIFITCTFKLHKGRSKGAPNIKADLMT